MRRRPRHCRPRVLARAPAGAGGGGGTNPSKSQKRHETDCLTPRTPSSPSSTARWPPPRRIFVCSMTDLFGAWMPDEWIDRIFAVMALAPQHTFQVLTKRPERMRAYLEQVSDERDMQRWARWADIAKSPCAAGIFDELDWPIANAHLGVSVEDQ